ncbi:RNA polymerase sigma-70 factor [Fibrisoma montanum]|uniref:RNA polymerase sigma-70 factor n=1 Tax=Fibrisoma montanum TaxID=2305895 RepID=A0A418M6N6_9BACT|nr:RNA polymerase sigma-70 factor [Fibrisoma montanum]RIV21580.1 RNA polymerase sigma-70 factor [Fibrisoma montanum]
MLGQELSDEILTGRLRHDDEQAFKTLYDRHWYDLYVIACRKLRDSELAQDLVQELFLTLWQKRETLRVDSLKAYLTTSLRNRIIDHVRMQLQSDQYAEYVLQALPTESQSHQTTSVVQYRELSESLNQALAQLPDKTREVFLLNRFERMTTREIAAQLGLSEKTIEYHLSRSTSLLRAQLQNFATMVACLGVFWAEKS